jgi:hypothetical protein
VSDYLSDFERFGEVVDGRLTYNDPPPNRGVLYAASSAGGWPSGEWVSLGTADADGLTFQEPTVDVELADDVCAWLAGTTHLAGGVLVDGGVRFDRPDGSVVWISRDHRELLRSAPAYRTTVTREEAA